MELGFELDGEGGEPGTGPAPETGGNEPAIGTGAASETASADEIAVKSSENGADPEQAPGDGAEGLDPQMLEETPENIANELEELRRLSPRAPLLAMEDSADGEVKQLMKIAHHGRDANQICDLVERYEREMRAGI